VHVYVYVRMQKFMYSCIYIVIFICMFVSILVNRLYSFERKTLALLVFARTCMSARIRKSY
jgi:hypothetical protein